jgi:hypothetical protein
MCCIFEHIKQAEAAPFGGEASKIWKIWSSAHTFPDAGVAFLNTFAKGWKDDKGTELRTPVDFSVRERPFISRSEMTTLDIVMCSCVMVK